ncbi:MAG: 30S ribosome-binding factor RbfA [Deltaproteobacteria bacterium]|nr:30S ribosome-binding factor RbfA [Deltaproteobacteria bacterium]
MGERRVKKAASVISDFVSSLFVTRISDPRLRALTVTRARVSPDMRRAYIYYSILGGDQEKAEAEKALKKARGFVRANLASGLSLRFTPEVVFVFDKNPGYAQRVMEILATDPSIAARKPESSDECREDAGSGASAVTSGTVPDGDAVSREGNFRDDGEFGDGDEDFGEGDEDFDDDEDFGGGDSGDDGDFDDDEGSGDDGEDLGEGDGGPGDGDDA